MQSLNRDSRALPYDRKGDTNKEERGATEEQGVAFPLSALSDPYVIGGSVS